MSEPWTVIHTAQGKFEEDMVRAFLEAHEIPTTVAGEALRTTHGLTLNGLGAVRIMVPPDHVEEARDLLEKVQSGELELAAEHLESGIDGGGSDQ